MQEIVQAFGKTCRHLKWLKTCLTINIYLFLFETTNNQNQILRFIKIIKSDYEWKQCQTREAFTTAMTSATDHSYNLNFLIPLENIFQLLTNLFQSENLLPFELLVSKWKYISYNLNFLIQSGNIFQLFIILPCCVLAFVSWFTGLRFLCRW